MSINAFAAEFQFNSHHESVARQVACWLFKHRKVGRTCQRRLVARVIYVSHHPCAAAESGSGDMVDAGGPRGLVRSVHVCPQSLYRLSLEKFAAFSSSYTRVCNWWKVPQTTARFSASVLGGHGIHSLRPQALQRYYRLCWKVRTMRQFCLAVQCTITKTQKC